MNDFWVNLSGWQIFMYLFSASMIVFNVLLTIVITIGGVYDLIYFFKELRKELVETFEERTLSR